MTPTKEDLEDALTEVLLAAMTSEHPAVKSYNTQVAINIANDLPPESVARSRDYAAYRARALHGHK